MFLHVQIRIECLITVWMAVVHEDQTSVMIQRIFVQVRYLTKQIIHLLNAYIHKGITLKLHLYL